MGYIRQMEPGMRVIFARWSLVYAGLLEFELELLFDI